MTRPSYPGAARFVPATGELAELAHAAGTCQGCDLFERATGTVFGRGPATAELMLVGEQPGDVEDREGEPFIGPAGGVLNAALEAAGLADTPTYVTNAVKHFKWKATARGTRRIHDKPSAAQSTACRPWLAAELSAVRPRVLVALGATASASLLGPSFRLTQHRGQPLAWPPDKGGFVDDATPVAQVVATIHPSAVLRAPDEDRARMRAGLVDDLRLARQVLEGTGGS